MTSLLDNRKGQQPVGINSLGSIAITILIAVVIIGLGGTILEKIQKTQADNTATANDTLTWVANNTLISLSQVGAQTSGLLLFNNDSLVNRGSGDSANYSIVAGKVNITNSSLIWNGTLSNTHLPNQLVTSNLKAQYNYVFGSVARNTTGFGLVGITTFSEFVPTIAIVAAAAIVIGILLVFFGRRKEDR